MAVSIVAENLTKRYAGSSVPALDGLNLDIKAGEIYGYLGANGAGKSTTIRLLMNFLQPTGGSASICGLDTVRDSVAVKRQVGYLAGEIALYEKATGHELLDMLARLHGVTDYTYRRTLESRFEAELHKPIRELSKGNRQKLGIIQAFMHRPEVLILDEPTSGLDPLMQEAFAETVRECRARGAAVLMSSHNLAETQALCDRVGIIRHGTLVREQAIGELDVAAAVTFRLVVHTSDDVTALQYSKHLTVVGTPAGTNIVVSAKGDIAPALADLSRVRIRSIATEKTGLEQEFLEDYGAKT